MEWVSLPALEACGQSHIQQHPALLDIDSSIAYVGRGKVAMMGFCTLNLLSHLEWSSVQRRACHYSMPVGRPRSVE